MNLIKKGIHVTIVLFIIAAVYTVIINVFAQTFFKDSANGSIIYKNGQAIGSKYIGQLFTSEKYFHGRPSAYNYNTYNSKEEAETLPASGGSNLAVSNPAYSENLKNRIEKLLNDNPELKTKEIPVDMVTASGSGVDPNISIQGAMIQTKRIAKANNIPEEKIIELIKNNINNNMVNVLELNLALEKLLK